MPLRVAVSADGSVVASGNADGTVFLWDTASGKRIAMQRVSTWPILELSSAPTGSRAARRGLAAAQFGRNPAGNRRSARLRDRTGHRQLFVPATSR